MHITPKMLLLTKIFTRRCSCGCGDEDEIKEYQISDLNILEMSLRANSCTKKFSIWSVRFSENSNTFNEAYKQNRYPLRCQCI